MCNYKRLLVCGFSFSFFLNITRNNSHIPPAYVTQIHWPIVIKKGINYLGEKNWNRKDFNIHTFMKIFQNILILFWVAGITLLFSNTKTVNENLWIFWKLKIPCKKPKSKGNTSHWDWKVRLVLNVPENIRSEKERIILKFLRIRAMINLSQIQKESYFRSPKFSLS
jgi:hypothetical protein